MPSNITIAASHTNSNFTAQDIYFCILASLICFILHFRKMALWIVGSGGKGANTGTRWIMDDVIAYAVLFLQGTAASAWVIASASLLFQIYLLTDALVRRKNASKAYRKSGKILPPFPWGQVLYAFSNPFNKILIIVPSGLLYEYLKAGNQDLMSKESMLAALVMLFSYFTISTLISSITIILRNDKNIALVWTEFKEHYSNITIYILMLFPLGYLIALIYRKEPWGLLLLPIPLIAMHRAMKNIEVIFDEYGEFLYSLAYAIDARDHYTYGHSQRVALYSKEMAKLMNLSPKQVEEIDKAGKIHDLGKIIIPDSILHKPGKLDDDEYKIMKTHINALKSHFYNKKKLYNALPIEIASSHHERFDGKGYIVGQSGENIPLGGRILAVADVFDALTTDRPYRKGLTPDKALECIKQGSGLHFDPQIVKVFEEMFDKGILAKLMGKQPEGQNIK